MARKKKPREQLDAESAARKNARSAAQWALWDAAGKLEEVAPAVTGADVARARDDHRERFEAHKERSRRKVPIYRAQAAAVISPEELADLDDRIANLYPSGAEYALDAWCQAIVRATGRTPREVCEKIEAITDQASDMVRPAPAEDIAAKLRKIIER